MSWDISRAEKYIEQNHPCSIFIVWDNVNNQIISFKHYSLQLKMFNVSGIMDLLPFQELDQKFLEFQDCFLDSESLVDLPDYSFMRINLTSIKEFDSPDFASGEYIQNNVCFPKSDFIFRNTFRDVYLQREKRKIVDTSFEADNIHKIYSLLEKYKNLPEDTDSILKNHIKEFVYLSPELRNKFLQILRESQSYKLNRINENTDISNLDKVHVLDVVIPYLKDDSERGWAITKLYDALYYPDAKLFFSSPEILSKQLEFCVDKYYKMPPFYVHISSEFTNQYYRHFTSLQENYLHQQLSQFFRLSYLNNELSKDPSNEQLKHLYQDALKSLILLQINRLRVEFKLKKHSLVFDERFMYLKNYISFYLDFKIYGNCNEITSEWNKLINDITPKNQGKSIVFNLETPGQAQLKIDTITNKLMKDQAQFLFQNFPIKYPNPIPGNIFKELKECSKCICSQYPIYCLSFQLNSQIATFHKDRIADFCQKFMAKFVLTGFDPFVVVLEQGYNQDKAIVTILGTNVIMNLTDQIHTELSKVRAELIFEELKKEYLLPVLPQYSHSNSIRENLKNIDVSPKVSPKSNGKKI